jgi:hypothetical protein
LKTETETETVGNSFSLPNAASKSSQFAGAAIKATTKGMIKRIEPGQMSFARLA